MFCVLLSFLLSCSKSTEETSISIDNRLKIESIIGTEIHGKNIKKNISIQRSQACDCDVDFTVTYANLDDDYCLDLCVTFNEMTGDNCDCEIDHWGMWLNHTNWIGDFSLVNGAAVFTTGNTFGPFAGPNYLGGAIGGITFLNYPVGTSQGLGEGETVCFDLYVGVTSFYLIVNVDLTCDPATLCNNGEEPVFLVEDLELVCW